MSNNNGLDLIKGLAPVIELPEVGKVFRDTTHRVAEKVAEQFRSTFGISEVDNVIIIPKIARNAVGASDMTVTVYFNINNSVGEQNIFYRGKGNNRNSNGRISIVNIGGGGNHSQYGTSDNFRKAFSPLCKTNNNGKAIMDFKSVQGAPGIVSLELDFNAVICFALGVRHNDAYDCTVVQVSPIGADGRDFSLVMMKLIAGTQKGKSSGVNYTRIEQDRFNQVNNGRGGNVSGGGRSY